jgi:hypothetical protein
LSGNAVSGLGRNAVSGLRGNAVPESLCGFRHGNLKKKATDFPEKKAYTIAFS